MQLIIIHFHHLKYSLGLSSVGYKGSDQHPIPRKQREGGGGREEGSGGGAHQAFLVVFRVLLVCILHHNGL